MTICNKFILGLVLCTGILASQAKAQYLITINDSNPDAVTFTGTGANATGTTSASTYAEGLILDGFAAPSSVGFVPTNIDTTSSLVDLIDGAPNYTSAQSAAISNITGIEISGTSGATPSGNKEDFVAGSPAFGGTVTFDLNTNLGGNPKNPDAFILPANGFVGNIYTYPPFFGTPTLIGTYIVNNTATPEPSQMALLLVGALGLLGVMRARSRGLLGSVLG
jgi:hypothetical protein